MHRGPRKDAEGAAATEQCLVVDGANFLNNAGIDGQATPPLGTPNIMMAAGGTQLKNIFEDDGTYYWKVHVDWQNPSKTKADGPTKIKVAPYHYLVTANSPVVYRNRIPTAVLTCTATRSCNVWSTGKLRAMNRSWPRTQLRRKLVPSGMSAIICGQVIPDTAPESDRSAYRIAGH